MHILVIYCHPCADSFCAAIRDTTLAALRQAGHEARCVDLYARGFKPAMSAKERHTYHTPDANEAPVAADLAALRWAHGLVFIYPTWWFGLPAMLKGWLDRTFVPHATFSIPTEREGMRGKLSHIRVIVAVTTCGASWWVSKYVGEPGRKTLLRGLRSILASHCRTHYLALYNMDTIEERRRRTFLHTVARRLSRLEPSP